MKVNRVIITGGPSTGKTSIINKLEVDGYKCLHEKSREIIQESLKNGSNVVPWDNLVEFSKRVIDQRLSQYHSVKSKNSDSFTFFDRGIPDVVAYMKYDNLEIPTEYLNLCKELRYNTKVFLAPAWKEIYETDNERVEDFYKAEHLQNYLSNIYKSLGYSVILVPKLVVEERVKFILSHLE